MVLVVRSELVRRYPSVLVAAVPAEWKPMDNRSPVKNPPRLVLPAFRGRIGADVLYAGILAAVGHRRHRRDDTDGNSWMVFPAQ